MANSQPGRNLFAIPISTFFSLGFVPPLIGAIISIGLALWLHQATISNYDWQCGRTFLPSVSRIINLPLERTFWQLFVMFHAPMRFVEIFIGCDRYRRLMKTDFSYPQFYTFIRWIYFATGMAEILLLIGLSLIGEREQGLVHVITFYTFSFVGIAFMISNLFCHRQSLYYFKPYGRTMYYSKMILLLAYLILVPVILITFIVYWKYCYTWGYTVFALSEYIGVFVNILYHGCAFFDVRYKLVICIR